MTVRFGVVFGALALAWVLAGCSCNKTCGPGNCASGCCDAAGTCQLGNALSACGSGGEQCAACGLSQSCQLGRCMLGAVGGGSTTGGGAGGGASTGGGSSTGGGGGASTGGGSATGGGAGGGSATGGGAGGGGFPACSGGTDGGTNCFSDTDCPDPQLFFCNAVTSLCEPSCRSKADCTDAVRGVYALPCCSGPLGCQCDEGRCVVAMCSADADCGTSAVCRDGQCVAPVPATVVASCRLSPDFAVMKVGDVLTFEAFAVDATGAPVVPSSGVFFSAATTDVQVTGGGPRSADFSAVNATSAPVAAVRATVNGNDCFARVLVVGSTVAANTLEVVATDELTGRPVAGATVLLSNPASGAALGNVGTTDGNGVASLGTSGAASVSVSVFHDAYTYVTIAGYPTSGDRLLGVRLRRNAFDQYGGFTGTLASVPPTANMHLGWVSTARPLADPIEQPAFGPPVNTHIVIGAAVNSYADLAAGQFMTFSTNNPIKTQVSAWGLAGLCYDPTGATDEASIAAGTCGTTTGWAVNGDVPLGDLPISAFGGTTTNWGLVLPQLSPIWRDFSSSVARDVSYTRGTTPRAADGGYALDDTTGFTAQDLPFGQLPLGFSFVAKVPALPTLGGQYLDAVIVSGEVNLGQRGAVALGIGSAGNESPADTLTDVQSSLTQAGLVPVRMAPTHGGLEGEPYQLIAIAMPGPALSDAGILPLSATMTSLPSNQLPFDPLGLSPVDLGANGGFLPLPESAAYDFNSRDFLFAAAPALSGATMLRTTFIDSDLHGWEVLFDPSSPSFKLPAAPASFTDRTFRPGGAHASMVVQALRLTDLGNRVGFSSAVELGQAGQPAPQLLLTGWSQLWYP